MHPNDQSVVPMAIVATCDIGLELMFGVPVTSTIVQIVDGKSHYEAEGRIETMLAELTRSHLREGVECIELSSQSAIVRLHGSHLDNKATYLIAAVESLRTGFAGNIRIALLVPAGTMTEDDIRNLRAAANPEDILAIDQPQAEQAPADVISLSSYRN